MQLGLAAHSDQIWACGKVGMLVTIGGKYDARLGMPRSSADELWRSLFSCSPRSTFAPRVMVSAFECEGGTRFDAQLSQTVLYNMPNPPYNKRSQLAALRKLYTSTVQRS